MSGPADDRGRLTRGGGRYLADLASTDGTLAAGFIRSTVARGNLLDVDLDPVRASTGIIGAFAADDLAEVLSPLPVRYGPGRLYDWQLLARDWVSFVGEPIAMVVGSDRASVEEACELASVDYDTLPAVTDVSLARKESEDVVRPEVGSNVLFTMTRHEGDVDQALATAHLVVERRFHRGRGSACPLENRGVLAYEDAATGELLVCASTQIPHILRDAIAKVLRRPERSVRVLVPDVGGGFGLKAQVGAEECLLACAAHLLKRRVAWVEDRWENLVASNHARDEHVQLKVGFTRSGAITGVDAEVVTDVGAHSSYPLSAALEPASTSSHLFGCYRIPAVRLLAAGVATNKCPIGAYRGVGAPAAAFAAERILDDAATELGLSRLDIRRRNLLGRADMPYQHVIGGLMDCGDPLGVLEKLVTSLDPGEALSSLTEVAPRSHRPSKGRPRVGVGIAVFNEHSGPGSAVYRGRGVTEVPGYDAARVVFEEGGTFRAYISSADAGQRHAAVCRVQVAKALSVDPSLVNVVEGDTASCPVGTGTFASRFAVKQVGAAVVAADRMAGRLHRAAAAYLDCSPGDVQQTEGGYERRGSGGQVSFSALSEWLYRPPGGIGRLERVRETEAPVEELGFSDGDSTLPCGALLTVVEVDPETFIPKVRTIKIVEECGRVLDRSAVFGQLEGGAIMGLGDALLGEHLYDESGEITTSSLMDYLLPMIGDAPRVEVFLIDDEALYTERSETGSKGVGEAGTIGAVASIGCAVSDALRPLGGTLNELPATPLRVFRACQSADSSQTAAAAGPTGEPATS